MSRSINLSLTDELRAFIDRSSGDGTLFSTPSEFVRAVLREKKERMEAAALRGGVLEGYRDVEMGRHLEYKGDVRELVREVRRRDEDGWS